MRKLFLLLTIASILPFATAQAPAASTQVPAVHAACIRAVIVGTRKCIAAGQYCIHTRRANRDYHRYGYHCGRLDRNGRYHLIHYYY